MRVRPPAPAWPARVAATMNRRMVFDSFRRSGCASVEASVLEGCSAPLSGVRPGWSGAFSGRERRASAHWPTSLSRPDSTATGARNGEAVAGSPARSTIGARRSDLLRMITTQHCGRVIGLGRENVAICGVSRFAFWEILPANPAKRLQASVWVSRGCPDAVLRVSETPKPPMGLPAIQWLAGATHARRPHRCLV